MQAVARFLENTKFEVSARGHAVICDQPADNGGTDAGMTPPEFLLASLATCAGYYAAQYLKARNLPPTGMQVTVNADKATQPARLGAFGIDVEVPGLEGRHLAGVLRAVRSCLIHNTLLHAPMLSVSVNGIFGESPAPVPIQSVTDTGLGTGYRN